MNDSDVLSEQDQLLWNAMSALRGLAGVSKEETALAIEKYFGVAAPAAAGLTEAQARSIVEGTHRRTAAAPESSDNLPDDYEVN